MPGLALSNEFMLGTATVMIGPQADLYNLTPADNSIGLVKNFTLTSEPVYTELSQGVKNSIVHSVMTGNPVRATMEAYEYSASNLAYALGIEGADAITQFSVQTTVASPVTAAATSIPVTLATGITVGSYIMIMVDNEDHFVVRKVTAVATNTLTVDQGVPALASGKVVKKVNMVSIGSKDEQPYYAAKIAGTLASGENVVVHIPKIRIIKGFNLAFSSDNYGNLPIEFTVYDLVPTDPFYAAFAGDQAQLFRT